MWPKVFAQLVELLPHISRLVPMADKFFTSKVAAERANEAAMLAMAEGVRGDLGQVTKAHMGLYRQLQDQSAQITEVGEEVKRSRLSMEQHEHRMEALEKQVASFSLWLKAGVPILIALVSMVVVLLVRLLQR
jgi:peptidoglycan hydrolase CwlO-like protein